MCSSRITSGISSEKANHRHRTSSLLSVPQLVAVMGLQTNVSHHDSRIPQILPPPFDKVGHAAEVKGHSSKGTSLAKNDPQRQPGYRHTQVERQQMTPVNHITILFDRESVITAEGEGDRSKRTSLARMTFTDRKD